MKLSLRYREVEAQEFRKEVKLLRACLVGIHVNIRIHRIFDYIDAPDSRKKDLSTGIAVR
jgi:hypothetical protein